MLRRSAEPAVDQALQDTPVTVILGPRQVGKSTLARVFVSRERPYVTLDDLTALGEAKRNPAQFLDSLGRPVIIDEVQRAPELFLPIKQRVDRDRKPGAYLLTGSANVFLLPKIADSLAGRVQTIDLLPLTQSELTARPENNALETLLRPELDPRDLPDLPTEHEEITETIARGGFPEPASRPSQARRRAWFDSYVRTLLDRDVRDIANIEGLSQMPRLLSLLARRSGEPFNVLSLSRETGIPHTTLTRYVELLKALYLLQSVPAWTQEPAARFLRTPNSFLVDSGLLCALLGVEAKGLEAEHDALVIALKTFVANELARQIAASSAKPWLLHLRSVKRSQVDFVLQTGQGKLLGIQTAAVTSLATEHFAGLRYLAELAGESFLRGIVLCLGREPQWLGKNILALPIPYLWSL